MHDQAHPSSDGSWLRASRLRAALVALAVLVPMLACGPAQAQIVVTNTNDSGAGSLRAAITAADATPGSTITFNLPANSTLTHHQRRSAGDHREHDHQRRARPDAERQWRQPRLAASLDPHGDEARKRRLEP
jgi:hypothetical protein